MSPGVLEHPTRQHNPAVKVARIAELKRPDHLGDTKGPQLMPFVSEETRWITLWQGDFDLDQSEISLLALA